MTQSLDQAFSLAAAELGMASASWLFARELASGGGISAVEELRDSLGRRWPVLNAVCSAWLLGEREPPVQVERLVDALAGLNRVVVVGLETRWLDPLLAALPRSVRIALLQFSELSPDWGRVLANLPRVEPVELSHFQAWAGPRSALLTFVYGTDTPGELFASAAWLRVSGADTRIQFRELIGWNVQRLPFQVYPRWLMAVSPEEFTMLEGD